MKGTFQVRVTQDEFTYMYPEELDTAFSETLVL